VPAVIEIYRILVEIAKVIICMNVILGYQFKYKVKSILITLMFLTFSFVCIFSILEIPDGLYELSKLMLLLIIAVSAFEGKLVRIVTSFFTSYISICIIDMITLLSASFLFKISLDTLFINSVAIAFIDSLSLMILIILLIQKIDKKSLIISTGHFHWSFSLLIVWVLISLSLLITYIQLIAKGQLERISVMMLISVFVVAIGSVIIVILLSNISCSRDNYKAISKMNQHYLSIQQQYYVLLTERNEDIRRFRHDIKNHFLCLETLANEGKIQELKEYVSELSKSYSEISKTINTGSNIADAIINDIISKNPTTKIHIDGCLPQPLYISAVDLCTIFSNILANASEAVSKLDNIEQHIVNIEINNYKNKIYIKETNPVKDQVIINNNSISTTKSETNIHGFGLGNIKKCVNKYNGTVELKCSNMEFIIEIIIRNEDIDRLLQ